MSRKLLGLILGAFLALPLPANAAMWSFFGALNTNQEIPAPTVPALYPGGGVLTATLDDVTGLFTPWAQRLKRVFKTDILTCEHCGGAVKVIASIEDPAVIKKILDHLAQAEAATPVSRPFAHAPPQQNCRA